MTSPAASAVVGDVQPQVKIAMKANDNSDDIIICDGQIGPASTIKSNSKGKALGDAVADTRFTFPRDFPKVAPGGVTIISFTAFKERGICVEPRADDPEEREVDVLGIPTIAMKEHATDKCKTKTRRTKRKEERAREAKLKYLDQGLPVPWWEVWEENEAVRIAKPVNASDSRMSKFVAAAADFKTGRRWPSPTNSQIDPSHLWTLMKVFMGIEGIAKKKDCPSRKKVFTEAFSDDEDSGDSDMDMDLIDEDSDGEAWNTADSKERKAFQFMNDPEKMIKIFLSSYVRAKGIIWSKINLEQTPRLCKFFLEFLLRSRTLPRSEQGLRAAIAVTEQALKELPLTSELSINMPDKFSKGCRECWGARTEVFRTLATDDEWLKKLKENEEAVVAKQNSKAIAAGDEPNGGEGAGAMVVAEPEQTDAVENENGGWGVSIPTDSGWGSSVGETDLGWGAPAGESGKGGWGGADNLWSSEALEEAAAEDTANPWTTPPEELPCLMHLLGPTVLPLTHTTGIVEQSLRRVTELIPIPTNIPPKTVVSEDTPWAADPAGVEFELERRFPKVVLSPWLNWDNGEMPAYSDPQILNTSRGPVVDPPYIENRPESTEASATPKPHDPASDSITVIVHPDMFEKMVKGVCLAGTWVQMVRQPVEPGAAAPPKKKKGKKKKAPADFWYLDELAGVFPSYWTAK